MTLNKPEPEKYGWEPRGLESAGGWTIEGGEEAYYMAVSEYEREQLKSGIKMTENLKQLLLNQPGIK